jgi:hypothetical protein
MIFFITFATTLGLLVKTTLAALGASAALGVFLLLTLTLLSSAFASAH